MAVIPVAGVSLSQLRDTFGAGRSGGRSHKGIDIFASEGTPVLAAESGTVIKTGDSGLGGLRVWVRDDNGLYHYYAHLSSIGVRPGQRVNAGQTLGGVGRTGNARTTPPHLHYSVNPNSSNSESGALNPYSFLTGQQASTAQGQPAPASSGGGGGFDPQTLQMGQDAQRIEAESAQASAEHQQRVLEFMNTLLRGRQNRTPRPVRSSVTFDRQAFDPEPMQNRVRELQTSLDLTPSVQRRSPRPGDPTEDRAARLLGGMDSMLRRQQR